MPSKRTLESLKDYREAIPPEVRDAVLETLIEARMRGFDDFVDAATFVMAHVLVGNIPADVAETLKGYFELLFTAVTAHRATSGGGAVDAKSVERARLAARSRLESRVELIQTENGLEVAGIGIEAKERR